MTPRQIAAYLLLASRRKQQEAAVDLCLNALAIKGQGKDIQAAVKNLLK